MAQNPDLAHNTGRITDDQYDNLINGKSMNDGLDENGNRIVVASTGGGGSSDGSFGYSTGGWDVGNHYAVSKINYNKATGTNYYSDDEIRNAPGGERLLAKYS